MHGETEILVKLCLKTRSDEVGKVENMRLVSVAIDRYANIWRKILILWHVFMLLPLHVAFLSFSILQLTVQNSNFREAELIK